MQPKENKSLAIIIKGNPKYLRDRAVKPMAEQFYAEIAQILQDKGYQVEFDPGLPYTLPKVYAAVWVAHSRGIDRLRFAPKRIKTIALQTKEHDQHFETLDERGLSPLHYELSDTDRKNLAALPDIA